MRELIIKEVSGGLTEDKRPAIIIEFMDMADGSYQLMLAGGDLDSFESIWTHARQAIKDLESGKVLPDKKV